MGVIEFATTMLWNTLKQSEIHLIKRGLLKFLFTKWTIKVFIVHKIKSHVWICLCQKQRMSFSRKLEKGKEYHNNPTNTAIPLKNVKMGELMGSVA